MDLNIKTANASDLMINVRSTHPYQAGGPRVAAFFSTDSLWSAYCPAFEVSRPAAENGVRRD
jgi:hypothetical protein